MFFLAFPVYPMRSGHLERTGHRLERQLHALQRWHLLFNYGRVQWRGVQLVPWRELLEWGWPEQGA